MISSLCNYVFVRYSIVALINYSLFIVFVYLLGEYSSLPKTICFLAGYIIGYMSAFILNSKFVFKIKYSLRNFLSYCVYILVFGVSGTSLFALLEYYLRLNYGILSVIVIVLLFPMRFVFSKNLVFKT